MIVGEAPGEEEERVGTPFVGASGQELNRMLHEAKISRSECFITNVCRIRPPSNDISHFIADSKKDITHEHVLHLARYVKAPVMDGIRLLEQEIQMVKPNVILALGNVPLWALTGLWGITRWRGSMLVDSQGRKVIPTYHPAAILRQWDWRAIAVHDIRRASRFRNGEPYPDPGWNFTIGPDFPTARGILRRLQGRIDKESTLVSFDLETKLGHIDCAALAWSVNEAICIPFMRGLDHYWPEWEEVELVKLIGGILTHPNTKVVGQNLLYDSQYTYRWWHFVPRVYQDTMLSHHTAFAGLPKKLDFQASMYCHHYIQWKPDRGQWKEGG
jgi:DNA polymerase